MLTTPGWEHLQENSFFFVRIDIQYLLNNTFIIFVGNAWFVVFFQWKSMKISEKKQPLWIFQTQSICRTRQGIVEMKVRKIARIYLRGPSVWPLLFGAAMRGQGLEFCRWRFWLKILGDFLADMLIYMVYYGSIYSMTTGEGMWFDWFDVRKAGLQ